MKRIIQKLITIKNLFGLLYIIFYFTYFGINFYINRGNRIINTILLVLTILYFFVYIYCVYIEEHKKIKKSSKRIFVWLRKFLEFINACIILASVFTNDTNSFFTIFVAINTVLLFILYVVVDIASFLALYEFKRYKDEFGWKYFNRHK